MQIHMGTVEPTPLRPAKYILDGAPMERGAALRRRAESSRANVQLHFTSDCD